eukprot:11167458-Lingulodinium_polyedra.AAC.1
MWRNLAGTATPARAGAIALSFVGRIAMMAKSVARGVGSLKMSASIAMKWRWLPHIRIKRRDGMLF